jgi:tetratricopeptide (TPR) repeat protein
MSDAQRKRAIASGTSGSAPDAVSEPASTCRARKGIAFLDEEGYGELLSAANKALEADSTNRRALYNKAVALGFLGHAAEAYEIVFSLPEKEGSNSRWVFLGAGLRSLAFASPLKACISDEERRKRAAATTNTLRMVMTLKPTDAESWLTAADLFKSAGARPEDPVRVLRIASEHAWHDAGSLGALGDGLQEDGAYVAAAECYDRAVRTCRGDRTHALTQLAWFMVAFRHIDTARALLAEALAAAPQAREALFAAYYLDSQEGRLEEALGHIREVNALHRSRESGEAELEVLAKLGRAADQLPTLERFIESERDGALCTRWMARKARILLDGGQTEGALALVTATNKRYGSTGHALLVWAMALERGGKHGEALAVLDMCKGDEELIATTDYWLTRSSALSATTDTEKAVEAAWEATRRSPDDERGWKQVLFLSRSLGRPKDGAVAARHLMKCPDRSCEFLAAMLLSLMTARSYDAAGCFADALSAAAPTDPDTLYLLGSLYSRMGNHVKADECFAASETAEDRAATRKEGGMSHE